MIYTEKTKLAMKICFAAHRDQTDKSGLPYVFHPFHLAEEMPDEATVITALLHDVVEDSDITLDDISAYGFGNEIVDALRLLTHDKNEPYFEYIEKIKSNGIARTVKKADLKHNSDLSRLEKIEEKDIERAEKYRKAAQMLK